MLSNKEKLDKYYTNPGIFTVGRIIEDISGRKYTMSNSEVEFTHKGLKYRLSNWVTTELYSVWSDGREQLEFTATWLPKWVRWFCVKWIINFHPNRKRVY